MRRFFVIAAVSLFYFSSIGWIWQDPVAKKNKEGVKLYKEGRMDDALSKWRDAQIDSPDKEELHYNIGSALYGQKKYEDASNEYEKSLGTKDAGLHAKTYYNMGNSSYRMGKLPEAIEFYKKTLDMNSDDEDAKYNIEFVRKKIKEDLQKKESQQAKSQRENQEEQGESEEQKSQGQQEQQQQQEAQAKQEEKKEGEEKQEKSARKEAQEQQEGEQAKEGKMSKEDALRLLDALKDDEKDLQKELRTQPGEGRYRVEKDW
ncbi:MAG: tetratricopeptide repeat protein [Candidatus Omnitrophica bacterium]|nr:tetratricopeptide repeat protein [Candidatus Omnitrophota bacterium]